jgi:hypothetical protein
VSDTAVEFDVVRPRCFRCRPCRCDGVVVDVVDDEAVFECGEGGVTGRGGGRCCVPLFGRRCCCFDLLLLFDGGGGCDGHSYGWL